MRTTHSRLLPVRAAVALAAIVLALLPARGGETNRYTGDVWAFDDAKKIMAEAADITLKKYPDCDDATVEQKMVRVYRSDGAGECQDEVFTKVLTEKGKRANRTLSLSFMLPYDTVDVVKLEVLRPNGEVVAVDVAANSKEAIDDSQMAMNISDPNNKVLQVNIPRLEIGDVLHSITRTTIERPYIPGQYAEENLFEGRGYIRHMSFDVHSPADRPLQKIALRAEIPGTVKYSTQPDANGGTLHHWEVKDVPRMFDEPGMPPYEMTLQRLFVSTLPDWQAVSKWYWDLSKPHLDATTPEMKTTVDKLIAGAKTDTDKIKAIFYHVSKNIRYMGITPEKDRPGFEPHDVKLTFDKEYGVCRDKAALLVSLLRIAGLNSYPVLISVGTKRDPDVPDSFFNHAIVGVETRPGEYLLMDPTDENTRELLPSYDCDLSYLICRPEGERLLTSPIESPDQHLMRVKTTGTLSSDGRLEAKSELSFEGVNDNAYRDYFAHLKPDDQRRFFERNLKQALPGARLTGFKLLPENMLDMTEALRAELQFSVDGIATGGKGKSVLDVPWIGNHFGMINFILRDTGLDKRKYPMRTSITCGLTETVSIQLGDGFGEALSMPSCAPIKDDCLVYGEKFSYPKHALDCERELKLEVVEFSPAQYAELKDALKEMDYDARKTPVLAAQNTSSAKPIASTATPEAPVESDATILDSHKELAVTDAHTSVYRIKYSKRILSYNGKKREAELKIDYNPACQEVKLIHGTVISKDGVRQEISKEEINVMDAGWNASAKRYTGGKILVANLPSVDIGSTIEVELEITSKDRPFIAGFESFQLPDAMDHKSFQLSAPTGVAIRKMITGGKGLVKETAGAAAGGQQFIWETSSVKALPGESQLPPEWVYVPGIAYFIGDAGAYFKEVRHTMLERAGRSEKAAALARQLTADAKTRAEAVKAIRDFIVKTIRLAGPSFTELPLTELSAADTTLTDGYGHSADRAILFHAMLTAAGFKSEFVLASDLPPIREINGIAKSFPLPQSFSSPLVRIRVDGQTIYLNDTDQYSQLGTTPHDGRLGIVLANQACETISAAKQCEDKTETTYNVEVGTDGKTRIGVTRHLYGGNFNRLNRYFSELPPEEKRRYHQEIVSDMSQGARPTSDLTTKFDTYPGLEQYSVEIDNYGVVDGKYLYFDLPFTSSLFPAGADHRSLPLFIGSKSDNSVRAEIELPPGFHRVVLAPKSEKLQTPEGGGTARITSKQAGDKFVITHELTTRPAIVKPQDYGTMQEVESTLGKKAQRLFLLEKDLATAKAN